jgi:hypothetical protein
MVTTADLEWHLTGGTSNTNPFLSLGGEMSTTKIPTTEIHQIWDPVTGLEQTEGDVEYRWIVLFNKGNDKFRNPHFYFVPKDPNVGIELSRLPLNVAPTELDLEEIRPSEEEIGPEVDVPMPFTKATEDYKTTQVIGPDIPPNTKLYICLQRTIPDESESVPSIAYTLVAEGEAQ